MFNLHRSIVGRIRKRRRRLFRDRKRDTREHRNVRDVRDFYICNCAGHRTTRRAHGDEILNRKHRNLR